MSTVAVALQPALPDALFEASPLPCRADERGDTIILANGFLAVEIGRRMGVIQVIANTLTGERFESEGDCAGFTFEAGDATQCQWLASAATSREFDVSVSAGDDRIEIVFSTRSNSLNIALTYELKRDRFWIERRLTIDPGSAPLRLHYLFYGACRRPGIRSAHRELRLGDYDRPRLFSNKQGGVFVGVGWWFYTVGETGIYQNTQMDFEVTERFVSEPWYAGVFRKETPEPYAGWAWYRAFLQKRKDEHDKQPWWCYWNAGWGQWTIEINATSGQPYFDLCRRLGVKSICFGSGCYGKSIEAYARIMTSDATALDNLQRLESLGLLAGCVEAGPVRDDWRDPATVAKHAKALDELAARPGFGAFHFDFFYIHDTFTAKWHSTRYLRAAREKLAYTECHLGMAQYGPQYMREVLCNHPTDLARVNLAHFSNNWTGLRAFRESRAEWLHSYDHVIPEMGLYYLATNYHNGGHPRKYTDPEPMQLLYNSDAYSGCFNFHDAFGYRDTLMAVTAFSPYLILGHIEKTMPETDVAFTRTALRWIADNAVLLRSGRVCHEDRHSCVMSKLTGGRGLVYLINYTGDTKRFELTFPDSATFQAVYPEVGQVARLPAGNKKEFTVRGESLMILDVNGALNGFPPANPRRFPMDVTSWRRAGTRWQGDFEMPDIRDILAGRKDPALPGELLVIDLIGGRKSGEELGQTQDPDLCRCGDVELPPVFLDTFEISGNRVKTWKVAPWAFADRVWLVYRQAVPPRLTDPLPVVTLNGTAVRLYPRVNNRFSDFHQWECPLFYGDITDVCRPETVNDVEIGGIPDDQAPFASIVACA